MGKNILNYWAGLVLVASGFILFIFGNLLIYDKVCFHEYTKPVLYFEIALALFIFVVSCYVAWFILVRKGYEVRIIKKNK